VLHRLAAAVDILERRAREAADDRVLGALGDFAHRLEVAVGGERIAGLDDIDAHGVERLGDCQLFLEAHGRARALLAVAQGGVENKDAVLVGRGRGSHGSPLVIWRRQSRGARVPVI
jgi:hypothetical protein